MFTSKAEFVANDIGNIPKEVLLTIAQTGRKTKYELQKTTTISHGSIYSAVKTLEKQGILEGKNEGKTRIGLIKTSYGLTLFGFCIAIKYTEPKGYIEIVRKWSSLDPLIAKCELFLEKMGQEETERLIGCFTEAIKKAEVRERYSLFHDDFQESTLYKFFSDFKRSMVNPAVSVQEIKELLKDDGYYEPLMKEVEKCGFELQTLNNIDKAISRLEEIRKKEKEHDNSFSESLGLQKQMGPGDSFGSAIFNFRLMLEDIVRLRKEKALFQKWILEIANDQDLNQYLMRFVKETLLHAKEEMRWTQSLATDMKQLRKHSV